MTEDELLRKLEALQSMLVSVATGGPRIQDVNPQYQREYVEVDDELRRRQIDNPIPYPDLWRWYGRWRSGDLPSYQSRRTFLSQLLDPLMGRIRSGGLAEGDAFPITGWQRVDRTVGEMRTRLAAATKEEQYQAVGLLCREALISLAQAVYDPTRHHPLDGVAPS